jgi:hypothetical protein
MTMTRNALFLKDGINLLVSDFLLRSRRDIQQDYREDDYFKNGAHNSRQ